MRYFMLLVAMVMLVGCSQEEDTEVSTVVIKLAGTQLEVASELWARSAKEIETKTCTCKGERCFKIFMEDIRSFRDDAGGQKVSMDAADSIRRHTENAMKCALAELKKAKLEP